MKTSKIQRGLAAGFVLFLLVTAGLSQEQIAVPFVQTKESSARMTPRMAIDLLEAGNGRFMRGALTTRPIKDQFQQTAANGQYPFAAILSCMDSRTPSEWLFDLNNGDAFTIKVAGNVLTNEALGSLEYAIQEKYPGVYPKVHAKVIVVMGHTDCGAVKATITNRQNIDDCRGATPCPKIQPVNLIYFLRKIRPALAPLDSRFRPEDRSDENPGYVAAVARENVRLVIAQILDGSSYIKDALITGRVQIWGAMHNLSTGQVTFFPPSGDADTESR
jgi:carbonic anhydrase